ncbi:MAG: HAD hydrolase family protein [Candidatus Bathyarchaeota archaeon]|nr:HAD hydrolase family protein [Candidatus Bathyarchaeota archaeon A05DMB-5]MDH7557498.1 HAD hydrolase family protein [Candidatus Bathyarchaeota archaeon]
MKRVFVSDCEGPISKNDNAFELTAHFVPDGDKLFTVISKYDDVLADVLKKPHYKAGDTLKLILPFLKAYNVTDNKMREFSAQNLILISNVKDTVRHVRKVAYAFIVSTSYEHYLKALCKAIAFPYENTYYTKLNIDKYRITEKEKAKLEKLAKEIAKMPLMTIPKNARAIEDFSEQDQKTIRRLDEIFWTEMASMELGKILDEVNPVGGCEKAEAIKDVAQKVCVALADVMYVGDSITDVEAFRLVREHGGLTVSFNGNQYAVKNAEIAVLTENSIVTAVIADAFAAFGKEQTLRLVENWTRESLAKSGVNKTLLANLFRLYPSKLPKVKIITNENMETLAKESSEFRKKVRGEAIGRLG